MPGGNKDTKEVGLDTDVQLLKDRQDKIDDVVMNLEKSYYDLKGSSELNNQLLKQAAAHISEKVGAIGKEQKEMFNGLRESLDNTVQRMQEMDSTNKLKSQQFESALSELSKSVVDTKKTQRNEITKLTDSIKDIDTRVNGIEKLKTILLGISLIVGFCGTIVAIAVGIKTLLGK